LPEVYPVLTTVGHGQHGSGIGGFVVRNFRGTSTPPHHSEGRAADIYLDAFKDIDKMIGDSLF